MNLTIPTTSGEEKAFSLDDFLSDVRRDIDYLDNKYDSASSLLKDAMGGAMSWAPQAFMHKQIPDIKKVYNLAVQLLAICYATERAQKRGG